MENLYELVDYFKCSGTEELISGRENLSDYSPVSLLSNIF